MLEAEENLNSYKPPGCLYSQFALSRGDIAGQLAGFGTGEVVCCGVGSGCGACGGEGADCVFRWCWFQRFSWLFDIDSAFGGSGMGDSLIVGSGDC